MSSARRKTVRQLRQEKFEAARAVESKSHKPTVTVTEDDAKKVSASFVTVVRDQNGRGPGLKSRKNFSAGELVALYARSEFTEEKITKAQWLHSVDVGEAMFVGLSGGGLASFINDVCSPDTIKLLNTCHTVAQVREWAHKYDVEMASLAPIANINFIRMESGAYAFAPVDIKEGTDLYTMYGSEWWIERSAMEETNSAQTRLAMVCWLLSEGFFPAVGWVHGLWGVYYNKIGGHEVTAGTMLNYRMPDKSTFSPDTLEEVHGQWLRVLGFEGDTTSAFAKWLEECALVDVGSARKKKKKKAKKITSTRPE